ncbi:unnamed protein product [Prorocentrum cordatum]|uniref:Ion transport domain-containing protein n=1 Tax=Prorocentrum cordatum TaxID=2364126 RepID=A0ABN9VME6_9DINO|nr:unnamed protein product [Polarella glacialis]
MSLHKRCVFNAENSKALLYWDVLVSLTIFIVAMVAPYEALFMRPRLDMSFIRRRVLDAILVADMVLQFFVAFPDYKNRHGRMVTSQKVIVWHYLTGWFLVDIVGIFPVDCLLIWANTRSEYRDIVSAWFVFRALRLVRMLVLLRLMRTRLSTAMRTSSA